MSATSRLLLLAESRPDRTIQRLPSWRTTSSRPSGVSVRHSMLGCHRSNTRLIDDSVESQTTQVPHFLSQYPERESVKSRGAVTFATGVMRCGHRSHLCGQRRDRAERRQRDLPLGKCEQRRLELEPARPSLESSPGGPAGTRLPRAAQHGGTPPEDGRERDSEPCCRNR
jgi:hypothetical protein